MYHKSFYSYIEIFPQFSATDTCLVQIINDSTIIGDDALRFLFITVIGRKLIFAIAIFRVFTHPDWII